MLKISGNFGYESFIPFALDRKFKACYKCIKKVNTLIARFVYNAFRTSQIGCLQMQAGKGKA